MVNIKDVTLHEVSEFNDIFPTVWDTTDTEYRRNKPNILSKFMTFDIETTSLPDAAIGFMYVWTACFDGVCFYGRTWAQYQQLITAIELRLPPDTVCVCYCHALFFEFQFLRNFFHVERVFAREKRKVISAIVGKIEYRCSYFLTNMSLKKFLESTPNVEHFKQSGEEFNYAIIRYPDSSLTDDELYYCICDTLGLWEGIKAKIEMDDDTLSTVPLTSTGYVRRDFREVCQRDKEHMFRFEQLELSKHMYLMCKQATRGGISGTNAILCDEVLENVKSYDIKSSYPYQMMTGYFPANRFRPVNPKQATDNLSDYLDEYCCIIKVHFDQVECTSLGLIPYIPKAKCITITSGIFGNGKVYSGKDITLACTEIDLKIILEQYSILGIQILEMNIADRELLSYSFRSLLHDMFQEKTDLEDGDPYLYAKFKNKINAAYGMMLTDILTDEITFDQTSDDPWHENHVSRIEMNSRLNTYYRNKNSFLSYQDGIWVLAHARKQLFEGMCAVGTDIVQVDTDSVKFVHGIREHDAAFQFMNERIINRAYNYNIEPFALKKGEPHYLGVWEYEGEYPRFKTLGAKKYCYEDKEGHLHITVAGLNKQLPITWLEEHGGIEKGFEIGTVVPEEYSGRTAAYYNDYDSPKEFIINGHHVITGSNICVKPVPYTFGLTDEWLELVMAGRISEDAERM